ncbi:MAG: citrate (Si)-synthase, partial [Sedimenticola sp.]|nr:citrate (Si)-synthase [Sedimenticola sp.]
MSDKKVTLTNEADGTSVDLPVYQGTEGPDVADISALYKNTGMFTYDPGFVATASCRSAITYIDGDKGILRYRGYPIEQLAKESSFIEVAYLLMYGDLPNADELVKFENTIRRHTMLKETLKNFFDGFQ